MIVTDPSQYTLETIQVHHGPRYKYVAILRHKNTGRTKRVPFGGKRADGTPYEQYHDKVGHYAAYDHADRKRRALYRVRHAGEQNHKFSAGWFSWKYLW